MSDAEVDCETNKKRRNKNNVDEILKGLRKKGFEDVAGNEIPLRQDDKHSSCLYVERIE